MRLSQLVLLAATISLGMPVLAADNPDLADAWIVQVKDGHDDQFEKALKSHLKYRGDKGDPRAWQTYAPVIGDDLDFYVIRYCCVTYADMDGYQKWTVDNKTTDHWNKNVDPHIAKYQHFLARLDFENGNWPEDSSKYKMFGVTSWDKKQGHAGKIAASKKSISDAAKSGGWPRYWAWSDQIGGEGGLTLVTPYKNYAEIEGPKGGFLGFLAKQHGEEKAGKMLNDFSSNFHSSSYTVYRLRDDLSMAEKN